jgi:eukaryotic-like serine/threonine-protein kinase
VAETRADLQSQLAPEFEILRPLGDGSTGSVLLARESALRRLVAIKVPRAEIANDTVGRQRFEREARAAARVQHPSACAIHRIGHLPDGTPYLVMEYVKGRTLDDLLAAEGACSAATGARILAQVASALAAAHEQGVLHRDVRPNSVIWDATAGRAVLTDFGLAGILDTGSEAVTRLTVPGQILGSLAYSSPEQLLGEPLTPASDVYGLGLLAFELFTGRRPFEVEQQAGWAAAHLHQPPLLLSDVRPDLDPRLSALIARCLAKNDRHRPDAASIAHAAERLGAADGTTRVGSALHRFPALSAFFAELKRRRVYNVLLIYAAATFVGLQAAQLIIPALPLPDWAYPFIVAATLAGLPVALVLAWMYDITAAGVRRTDALPRAGPRYMHWLLPALGLALSLLLAAAIGWWVLAAR